jgi:hypothetical protein
MADTRESLRKKRLAYLRTFCGPGETPHVNAEAVLADLRKFCGVTKPGIVIPAKTGMVDSHATAYLAGQRDVYLRIIGFLSIDERHLFQGDTHEPQSDQSKTAST